MSAPSQQEISKEMSRNEYGSRGNPISLDDSGDDDVGRKEAPVSRQTTGAPSRAHSHGTQVTCRVGTATGASSASTPCFKNEPRSSLAEAVQNRAPRPSASTAGSTVSRTQSSTTGDGMPGPSSQRHRPSNSSGFDFDPDCEPLRRIEERMLQTQQEVRRGAERHEDLTERLALARARRVSHLHELEKIKKWMAEPDATVKLGYGYLRRELDEAWRHHCARAEHYAAKCEDLKSKLTANVRERLRKVLVAEEVKRDAEAERRRRQAEKTEAIQLARRSMEAREQLRQQRIADGSTAGRTSRFEVKQRHRGVQNKHTRAQNANQLRALPPKDIDQLLRMPEIDIPRDNRPATPIEMSCKLLPHQQVALKWLKEREEDEGKRGGLLADTMGLGKTIEALALILSNKAPVGSPKTTLVVAPLAIMRQWEREIREKVKPAFMLTTFIYHGPAKRSRDARSLFDYDVVLTNYETVASDYRNYREHATLLFKENFFRIILDEAHRIKNRNTLCSRAVAALQSQYRLCMTGTPFMNSAVELYPLLRFLQIKPYNDLNHFRGRLERPIRNWKKDPEGYRRALMALQVVFRSMTLRRTKDSRLDGMPIVTLPEKMILECDVVLDEEQRKYYTAIAKKQRLQASKYLKKGMSNKVYLFILVLLLRLRQVCCHPWLIMDHGIPEAAELNGKQMVSLARKLNKDIVERLVQKTDFRCPLCDEVAETTMIIYPCGHDICAECFSNLMYLSQGQRPDDPARVLHPSEEVGAECPGEDCSGEIHPKKVFCYTFFRVAHGIGDADREVKDGLEDDQVNGSDSGPDDEPTKSGDDFIVDDDEVEYEEESSEQEEGSDGETDESEEEDPSASKPHRRRTLQEGLLESEDESDWDLRPIPRKEVPRAEEEFKNGKKDKENVWTYFQRRQSEGWKVQDESDSDTSFASITDLLKTPVPKEVLNVQEDVQEHAQEDARGASQDNAERDTEEVFQKSSPEDAAKRKREEEDKTPEKSPKQVKTRRITESARLAEPSHQAEEVEVEEGDEEEDEEAKTNITPKKEKGKNKNEDKKRKGKQKQPPPPPAEMTMTLSSLRKKSLHTKSARARYFARLRRDFVSSAKIDALVAILQDLRATKPGEKTLVFSLWTSFLDLLEIPLQDHGFRYLRYDGALAPAERDDHVKQFQDVHSGTQILLVSLQAGNAGLNLTAASHVVVTEPFWNPFVEDQAVDRAHRLGQTRPVTVYRLLVRDSVEDGILKLQRKKRALVEEALSEQGAIGAARLSVGELRGLFGI